MVLISSCWLVVHECVSNSSMVFQGALVITYRFYFSPIFFQATNKNKDEIKSLGKVMLEAARKDAASSSKGKKGGRKYNVGIYHYMFCSRF